MSGLTVSVLGASGRMGRQHASAYEALNVPIVNDGDIVSIATPDRFHARQVIDALENGKHVFCEKPLCRDYGDLQRIVSLCSGKHVKVNYPLRYYPEFLSIKNRIASLGSVYRIEASYNWGRAHKLKESWRKDDPDYSLVMGGLIHMIDLVVWMGFELNVVSVMGTNLSTGFHKPDTVIAICELKNGGLCTLTVDGGTGVNKHCHFMRIHGSQGWYAVENFRETDKTAAIREFVSHIRNNKAPDYDFRATELALEIECRLR